MPDLSYNKRQQKERPPIRQIAQEFLREELQAQLEPFLRYIEEKKFPFSLARCNTYESKYKGSPVFRVEIALGQACVRDTYAVKIFTVADITHFREPKEQIEENLERYLASLESDMAEYYLAHQSYCRGCGKCKPGVTLAIRGKAYPLLCACDMYVMRVTNPRVCFKTSERRLFARKQSSSASKILAVREYSLRFFPRICLLLVKNPTFLWFKTDSSESDFKMIKRFIDARRQYISQN